MHRRALAVALLVLPGCALQTPPLRLVPLAAPLGSGVATASPPAASASDRTEGAGEAGEDAALLDDDVDDDQDLVAQGSEESSHGVSLGGGLSPSLRWSDTEVEQRYRQEPASLGPLSVGRTNGGLLLNGVQMPKSDRWTLLDPGRAWGTQETVDALQHIIGRVHERYPETAPLPIGHLSAKGGGHLSPHVSHQSGRDADVGYYHRTPVHGFLSVTENNLDMPRTWALVRAAVRETDVEMILMNSNIQRLLAGYAALNGEDPNFIDHIFQIRGKNPRAPIRHVKGHGNHLHFRFRNPVAEEMGRRVARFIPIPRVPAVIVASHTEVAGYVQHRARSGDTLMILARRYGTTIEDIRRANGLKSVSLRAGAVYRIPQKAPPSKSLPPAHARPSASNAPKGLPGTSQR